MGNLVFNTGKLRLIQGASGAIDLLADAAVKIMALEVDDEPDDPDIEFVGDLLGAGDADEVTSAGYTGGFGGAGRKALASKTLAVDQANDRAEFDAADITWTSITQAGSEVWAALAMVKEITNDAASPLIHKLDTGTGFPLTPNGSDITVTWDAQGILQWT